MKKGKQDWKEITKEKMGFDVDACPCCKTGRMKTILNFAAHAPPPVFDYSKKNMPYDL